MCPNNSGCVAECNGPRSSNFRELLEDVQANMAIVRIWRLVGPARSKIAPLQQATVYDDRNCSLKEGCSNRCRPSWRPPRLQPQRRSPRRNWRPKLQPQRVSPRRDVGRRGGLRKRQPRLDGSSSKAAQASDAINRARNLAPWRRLARLTIVIILLDLVFAKIAPLAPFRFLGRRFPLLCHGPTLRRA